MIPLVVSFFTPNGEYPELAARLARSCEALGLESCIEGRGYEGLWVEIVRMKPAFLLEMRNRHPGRPLLWIDADGEVMQLPHLLINRDDQIDIAMRGEFHGLTRRKPISHGYMDLPKNWPASFEHQWFNSGTVYFGASPIVDQMLQRWWSLAEENPRAYQDWLMAQAWCDCSPTADLVTDCPRQIRTLLLDRTYCWISRMYDRKHAAIGGVVIRHDLASVDSGAHRRGRR